MRHHLSNVTSDHFLAVKIRNFTCHEQPLQTKIADHSTHVPNLIDELSSAEDQCHLLPNLIGRADLILSIIIKFHELSLPFESMPLHKCSNCLGQENTRSKKNYVLRGHSHWDRSNLNRSEIDLSLLREGVHTWNGLVWIDLSSHSIVHTQIAFQLDLSEIDLTN